MKVQLTLNADAESSSGTFSVKEVVPVNVIAIPAMWNYNIDHTTGRIILDRSGTVVRFHLSPRLHRKDFLSMSPQEMVIAEVFWRLYVNHFITRTEEGEMTICCDPLIGRWLTDSTITPPARVVSASARTCVANVRPLQAEVCPLQVRARTMQVASAALRAMARVMNS